MKSVELAVQERDSGRDPAALRRDGEVPAIVYGPGGANVKLQLNGRELSRSGLLSQGAHLISLKCDAPGLAGSLVLIKEVQAHPVSGVATHVDFLRVDANKPVTAAVVLHYVGKAAGVVEGGILNPIRRELEVRALPAALPEEIEVDVSELAIQDSIHVADLTVPEGVEILFTENFTLVTVVPPIVEETVEEEEVEEGAEPAADGAEAGEATEKPEESGS